MTNFSSGTCTILRIKNFSCPPPSTPNLIHLMYIAPLVCCHISFMFFRWAFLVATPFIVYIYCWGVYLYVLSYTPLVVFIHIYTSFWCNIAIFRWKIGGKISLYSATLSYTPLVVFIYIYLCHLINDMKLESSFTIQNMQSCCLLELRCLAWTIFEDSIWSKGVSVDKYFESCENANIVNYWWTIYPCLCLI